MSQNKGNRAEPRELLSQFTQLLRRCRNIKGIDSLWKDTDASQTLSHLPPQLKLQGHKREVQRCDLVRA